MALVAGCSGKGVAQVYDPETGSVTQVLKDCHPCANGLAGSAHFMLTTERERSFIHLWSWAKESPQYRCQAPERLSCVLCTADSAHCLAGAASGKLYLWQLATGRLLVCWDAHFKSATALASCDRDGWLLSAGEDALIFVWSFASLLDAAESGKKPRPHYTWSSHALSVTALCTASCGQHPLIASASLDQTVRVWRLAEGHPGSVHCAELAEPLSCVAAHPAHTELYAGGTEGRVYKLSLLLSAEELSTGAAQSAEGPATVQHEGAVHALCVAIDGLKLFSAAADGGVWVWDASSLALLRRFDESIQVDCLAFLPTRRRDETPPLAPLKKYAQQGASEEPTHEATPQRMGCVPVLLQSAEGGPFDQPELAVPMELPLFDLGVAPPPGAFEDQDGAEEGDGRGADAAVVAELRAQCAQWQRISTELFEIAGNPAALEGNGA